MRMKITDFYFGRVHNSIHRFNTKLSERGWMRDSLMYRWKLKARGGGLTTWVWALVLSLESLNNLWKIT